VRGGGLPPHAGGPISNPGARALAWWCVPRGDEVVGLQARILLGVSVWRTPQRRDTDSEAVTSRTRSPMLKALPTPPALGTADGRD